MGVSGCGKTTLAHVLGEKAGWPVLEGDDFHPPANIRKMAAASPLTDVDRKEWVRAIRSEADSRPEPDILLSCSALTPAVQDWLGRDNPRDLTWLWLDVSPEEAGRRVAARSAHFMPAKLVTSQFDALRPPADAHRLQADLPVEQLAGQALRILRAGSPVISRS
ncbi:gluconokinase [Maricaulis sp.]|uniref:gluconokinase n=1 Tax=Maricaulis sp. TaxID=1486257 RepID=UPI003A9067F1